MSTKTWNLKTCSSALCLAVLLALLKGSLCIDLESYNGNNYFTAADILAPFQSCQIKLMMVSRHMPALALQMILELSESWIPYESLYDIPTLRVHYYARRYRDHCIAVSVISAIPWKGCPAVAPKYFFMPLPSAMSRALSIDVTHFFLRIIVAEILSKAPILTGIPSVRIHSLTRRPILTKIVLFDRA